MIPKEALEFIEDLKNNNNRDWFLLNKKRYESYKKAYHELVGQVLEQMKITDPSLDKLEIKNCTFRINRDIRFSKNKMPYKTNMALWFSTNRDIKNAPGYYIHYEKGQSFIAGGLYGPEAEELKKVRKEIAFFYDDLEQILQNPNFKKEFKELSTTEENSLKRAPKDYEIDHPAIDFLKLKSFITIQKVSDDFFLDKNFASLVAKKLSALKPFIHFLNRALETSE
jgi:uncharacterized protein (TIGR02453 family)